MLSFFPRGVLDEILNLIESVSEGFPSYSCRIEVAKQTFEERQEILNARSDDMALFHRLVNKQKGRLSNFIDELNVSGTTYKSEDGVLNGWFEKFKRLASVDEELFQSLNYHKPIQHEFPEIEDICKWSSP